MTGGPALEEREQFKSYDPPEGAGLKAQDSGKSERALQDVEHVAGLSDTSSPTAYTSSHPPTPPAHDLGSPAATIVDLSQLNLQAQDKARDGFHPATLAQKLAAHEAAIGASPSPSIAAASTRATASGTPRSELDTPPLHQTAAPQWSALPSSVPKHPTSLLSPNNPANGGGADSSDSSAFSSRVSTLASDFSPHHESPSALSFAAEHAVSPVEKPASAVPEPVRSSTLKPSGVPEGKERSVSPSKARPAVFSAIPPKDAHVQTPPQRPPLPEKKSVLGKMLDGMRSKDSLHLKQDKAQEGATRPRGRSSASEAESGGESDSKPSGFLKLSRKMSGGKKEKEREREAFLSEQDKAAAMARGDVDKRGRTDSKPPALERRGSHDKKADLERRPSGKDKSEGSTVGESLKSFMERAPLMHRKSSVTSKKSDDGKSDRGSQYGDSDSHYEGGSKKAATSSASLLKKYGACEKVAIGKGATAVVRLAHKWDKTTEKLYAVKEFRKRRKNESERDYVKKLTSEFCISSTLHHANIVETVDLVQDENHHWCEVMEYCPGGDLYAAIKRGDLTQTQINSYFQQMVSGVAYLHSMGVAHRDIKPENLLLDANDQIKITDFGVSDVFRMCWEKTCHLSKGLCGSEPYIAPEQFESKAQYDARLVDVWACAVVFYCMQFQELPWRVAKLSDPSYAAFVEAYPNSPSPPPLSDIEPKACRPLIKSMLNPSPTQRATTETILKDPWFMSLKPITSSNVELKLVNPSSALNSAMGR